MSDHSSQPDEPRRMLIPQYSIRWLLGVTTAAAGVFSIVALGIRGHAWAAALSIAFLSIVILGLVYAAAFGLVWVFSLVTSPFGRRLRRNGPGESPFSARPLVSAVFEEPRRPQSIRRTPEEESQDA